MAWDLPLSTPISIRPFVDATDRAAMIALYRIAWHAAYDAIDGPDAIDRLIEALLDGEPPSMFALPPCDVAIVATAGRFGIVGGMRAHPREGIVHLSGVYVYPAWFRSGAGSALLANLLGRQRIGAVIQADVRPTSKAAVAFYRRHGFEMVGTEHTNVGGDHWVDTLIMQLKLV